MRQKPVAEKEKHPGLPQVSKKGVNSEHNQLGHLLFSTLFSKSLQNFKS